MTQTEILNQIAHVANSAFYLEYKMSSSDSKFLNKTSRVDGSKLTDRYPMGIVKVSKVHGFAGHSLAFDRKVELKAEREGVDNAEYEAQPMNGFVWVQGAERLVMANKAGEYALRGYPTHEEGEYIDPSNGAVVSKADLAEFLPPPRKPSVAVFEGGEKVEKPQCRSYLFKKIEKLSIGGVRI